MFESALFFALFVICVNGNSTENISRTTFAPPTAAYDPRKWNYCPYNNVCKFWYNKPKAIPTSCKIEECNKRGTRSEVELERFMEFRKEVVDKHNYWRNYYAAGNEEKGFSQPVSDMLIMNYDVELEHLARCWGRGYFNGYHDPCRVYHDGRPVGQNIAGRGLNTTFELKWFVNWALGGWYEEVKWIIKSDYQKFPKQEERKIGHFTQLVWGPATYVGCARVYAANVKQDKFLYETFVTSLICDYVDLKGFGYPSNMYGAKIFTQGPPCTKCPKVKKYDTCNPKYPALCGELQPIPTNKPYAYPDGKSSSTKLYGKMTVLIFTSSILMLL
ncbi:CRISP/Allergen/PR-1-like Protein [Tribolium castaneum]|uniref:CRISP/Allergen/PR-1-like Protein n=1 Tax=Tribolium castaneum TaxID=7070 RepID=A0A139WHH5_TRICA|nr:PREDICTED: venom allergen 5-like [Tribolium castaneum]KYB27247.1 CRISP/Allergen/PR-1-like Protein [Tribolium castaneum]|eukprot:XP_008193876.1 PREDICTED: venom allergen 5-like [Tribolium castaneum]